MSRLKPMGGDRVRRLAQTLHEEVARALRTESVEATSPRDLTYLDAKFQLRPVADGFEMDYECPVRIDDDTLVFERVRVTVRSL